MEKFEPKVESKEKEPEIVVAISTREEELKRIENYVKKFKYYGDEGYYVNLPEYYKNIAKKVAAGEVAFDEIKDTDEFNQALEYSAEDYAEAASLVKQELEKQQEMTKKITGFFAQWQKQWGFKLCEKNIVQLAMCGTRGSYYGTEDVGRVILRMSEKDMRDETTEDIYRIVVHELVHIGIQDVIIKKYGLDSPEGHWKKECIVDLICAKIIGLPNYEIQKEGDPILTELEKYVTKEAMDDLPKAIEAYIKK